MKKILDRLLDDEFLQIIEKNDSKRLSLKPPITIIIRDLELKLIEQNLTPKEEKGGLIIFEARKIGDKKIFESKYIKIIPNISENNKEKYDPDKEKLNKIVKCSEERDLMPMTFHSHPFENFVSFIEQLNPSDSDIFDMSEDKIMLSNKFVILPDILIIPKSIQLGYGFIGFYCGDIVPPDFNEQKGENFKKIIQMLKLNDKELTWIGRGLLILLLMKPQYIIKTICWLFVIGGTVPYMSFDGLPKYFSLYSNGSKKIEILLPEIDMNS